MVLALAGGSLMTLRAAREEETVAARNPFELDSLVIFAGLFALTTTISAALVSRIGNGGLVALSATSGTFDVDVAVLSALRTGQHGLRLHIIGKTVLAAVAANAVGRMIIAIASRTLFYCLPIAVVSILAMSAGGCCLSGDPIAGMRSKASLPGRASLKTLEPGADELTE